MEKLPFYNNNTTKKSTSVRGAPVVLPPRRTLPGNIVRANWTDEELEVETEEGMIFTMPLTKTEKVSIKAINIVPEKGDRTGPPVIILLGLTKGKWHTDNSVSEHMEGLISAFKKIAPHLEGDALSDPTSHYFH